MRDSHPALSIGGGVGESQARLAIDGPRRLRTLPFRHLHSPRERRRDRRLEVHHQRLDESIPGRLTGPEDLPNAGATRSAEEFPHDAQSGRAGSQTSSTDTATTIAATAPAITDVRLTVRLDLAPLLATWRRVVAGPRPDGAEATPFLLFAHALLSTLPSIPDAVGGRHEPGAPLTAQVEVGGSTIVAVSDGHDLTILGLLRRLDQAPLVEPDDVARLVVRDGTVRGARHEVPPRTGDQSLAVSLGVTREEGVITRDEFGHQVTALRPVADLTLRYDTRRVTADAVGQLLDALRLRLAEFHTTAVP